MKTKPKEKKTNPQSAGKDDGTAQHIKAINDVLKKLDEESLVFLYKQAKVLLHNMEAAKLQAEFAEIDVKASATRAKGKDTLEVIEADDLRHFIFVINGARNFLSRDEMKKIVKLCHSAGSLSNGMRMLYDWCAHNRKDIIMDTGIEGRHDKALETMYNYIVNHYMTGG